MKRIEVAPGVVLGWKTDIPWFSLELLQSLRRRERRYVACAAHRAQDGASCMAQVDDLKYIEPGRYRIWLSACGDQNRATVEIWLNGRWIESESYEAPSVVGFREKFGNKRLIVSVKS